MRPPTEALPVSRPGAAGTYREILAEYRSRQGGSPVPGPTAALFGQAVQASLSVANLNVDGPVARPVAITEWVAEAGGRVWIVRVSQVIALPQARSGALSRLARPFGGLTLTSSDAEAPLTSAAAWGRLSSGLPTGTATLTRTPMCDPDGAPGWPRGTPGAGDAPAAQVARPAPAGSATATPTPEAAPAARMAQGTRPSPTPSATPVISLTVTPSATPTLSLTVTPSATPTLSPTVTPSATPAGSPTVTPSATPAFSPTPAETPVDLPAPAWWSGDCDTGDYEAQAGVAAYPLGGSYRGVEACGPRPWADGATDVLVHFFSEAWGEYEWECVELAMRYLYLDQGVQPYSANGRQVVWNYPGTALEQIANGTAGQAPQPGDVLSAGSTLTFGHTMLVAASSVDGSGNGTIDIIEQNASLAGQRTDVVTAWQVQDSPAISGWLHDPASGSGQACAGARAGGSRVGAELPAGPAGAALQTLASGNADCSQSFLPLLLTP